MQIVSCPEFSADRKITLYVSIKIAFADMQGQPISVTRVLKPVDANCLQINRFIDVAPETVRYFRRTNRIASDLPRVQQQIILIEKNCTLFILAFHTDFERYL